MPGVPVPGRMPIFTEIRPIAVSSDSCHALMPWESGVQLDAGVGAEQEARRLTGVGFAVLALVMAGHAALETARDALFLERLPPERLPLAYIGIALLAVAVGRASVELTRRIGARWTLPTTLAVGAALTLAFLEPLGGKTGVALPTFYMWVGVFAGAVVVQLWTRLADLLDVGQAKQRFGFVGAGALIGASVGSAASVAILELGASPRLLLPVGAGCFVLAGVLALGLRGTSEGVHQKDAAAEEAQAPTSEERRYALRLGLGLAGAAVLFTVADLGFKTAVAEAVPPDRLGPFFAQAYTALNGAAVIVQLFVVPRMIPALGAHRAFAVLPALFIPGGAALALTGGSLGAALGLKLIDGTMRHGLYKTSAEILHMPLRSVVRRRFKALAEVAAQRGGQAVAAALVLFAFEVGAGAAALGAGVAVFSALWLLLVRDIGREYLELFRVQLQSGARASDMPELDLGALETLVEALSAEDEREVLGALDWFEAYSKSHLIPALILFHPSPAVTLRALALFDLHPRKDALRVARQRLDDPDPAVRAGALRLLTRHGDDAAEARRLAHTDESPLVRAEALASLVARGELSRDEACAELTELVQASDASGAVAAANALARLPPGDFGGLTRILSQHPDPEVAAALAGSLARFPHPAHAPALVRLIGPRSSRPLARRSLVALGEEGLSTLEAALRDRALPVTVRRQIPRVMSDFAIDAARARRVEQRLLDALGEETEGRVSAPELRALARLRSRYPDVPGPEDSVSGGTEDEPALRGALLALRRSVEQLAAGRALERAHREKESLRGCAAALLERLLRERSDLALEETFLWLHVARPRAGFLDVHEALMTGDRRAQASARELLAGVEPAALRSALQAFTAERPEASRLLGASLALEPSEVSIRAETLERAVELGPLERVAAARTALLAVLEEGPSATMRALARRAARDLEPCEVLEPELRDER